jgi:hypothetical protein
VGARVSGGEHLRVGQVDGGDVADAVGEDDEPVASGDLVDGPVHRVGDLGEVVDGAALDAQGGGLLLRVAGAGVASGDDDGQVRELGRVEVQLAAAVEGPAGGGRHGASGRVRCQDAADRARRPVATKTEDAEEGQPPPQQQHEQEQQEQQEQQQEQQE